MENRVGQIPISLSDLQNELDNFFNTKEILAERAKAINPKWSDYAWAELSSNEESVKRLFKQGLFNRREMDLRIEEIHRNVKRKYGSPPIVPITRALRTVVIYDLTLADYSTIAAVNQDSFDFHIDVSSYGEVFLIGKDNAHFYNIVTASNAHCVVNRTINIGGESHSITVVSTDGSPIIGVENARQLQEERIKKINFIKQRELEGERQETRQLIEARVSSEELSIYPASLPIFLSEARKLLPRFTYNSGLSDVENGLRLVQLQNLQDRCQNSQNSDNSAGWFVSGGAALLGGVAGSILGPLGTWAGAAAAGYFARKSASEQNNDWAIFISAISSEVAKFPHDIKKLI